jgi:replicative DNA helicase
VEEAARRFLSLSLSGSVTEEKRIAELAPAHMDRLRAEYDDPRALRGHHTGLPTLDRAIGGLCPGHLIVLAAPSGVGKSTLAVNMAVAAAKKSDAAALLFSLEMEAEEVIERMAFAEAGVDSALFRTRTLAPADWRALEAAHERLARLPITFIDDGQITLGRIEALCRRARLEGRCDLIVVDYVQLVEPMAGKASDTREREVAAIARGLKTFAQSVKVPVIALSQVNDAGKVRESRALFNDANVVLMLETDEGAAGGPDGSRDYLLHVAKNRAGRTGDKIPLSFQPGCSLFGEMDMTHEPT